MSLPGIAPQCGCTVGPRLEAGLAATCRWPLVLMFFCAAIWLFLGSLLALLAALKFHAPGFLAGSAWLTYGRLQPAHMNLFLYGFALPSAWAIALWMFVRLGRTPLRLPGLIVAGTVLWNVGVLLGFIGILAGQRTGFDALDMPRHALWLLFGAYLLVGVPALLTFRGRKDRELYVSQWFLLVAIFWFPWIFSTAFALLVLDPVRGVMQALVHWWYLANLSWVALGFLGLGILFYAIPRVSGRPLHSQYQALAAFWMLVLFVPWTGIPDTAPLPSWIPAVSLVFTVLLIVPLLAIAQNWHLTLLGSYGEIRRRWPLSLVTCSAIAFLLAAVLTILGSLPAVHQVTHFSFFTPGRQWLFLYGFVALGIFAAMYLAFPDLVEGGLPSSRLARIHAWCAVLGIVCYAVPMLVGGLVQGLAIQNPAVVFTDALRPGLMALRIATLGDLLLVVGHVALLGNLSLACVALCGRCCRSLLIEKTGPLPVEVTP